MSAFRFVGQEAIQELISITNEELGAKINSEDLTSLTEKELKDYLLNFDSDLFDGVLNSYYTKDEIRDMLNTLTSGDGEIGEITIKEMQGMWTSPLPE